MSYRSASATFATYCTVFLVYNGFLSLIRPKVDIVKIIDPCQWNSRRFYECSIRSLKNVFYQFKHIKILWWLHIVIFSLQHIDYQRNTLINHCHFLFQNNAENLIAKRSEIYSKTAIQVVRKGCSPVFQPYTRWPGWKSCVVAKKWLWWLVYGKKF